MEESQADLHRDVGRLEGTQKAQGEQLAAIDAKLDRVVSYIDREAGAKRAWLTAGSIGGGVLGATFSALVAWWVK